MNTDDVKRLVENPDLIEGIHNYCDRWCERCAFTSRCATFGMGKKRKRGPEGRDPKNQAFWDELTEVFKLTLELVQETAVEQGIDVSDLEGEGFGEGETLLGQEEARNHPIAKAGLAYVVMHDQWMKEAEGILKQKRKELAREVQLEIPGSKPHLAAFRISDAVEILEWYHPLVYTKMTRAIGMREIERGAPRYYPLDSDGSAKVALGAIERSMAAWGILRESFPAEQDSILDMLAHLERLRNAIEKEFPNARAFRRPGFDCVPGPG